MNEDEKVVQGFVELLADVGGRVATAITPETARAHARRMEHKRTVYRRGGLALLLSLVALTGVLLVPRLRTDEIVASQSPAATGSAAVDVRPTPSIGGRTPTVDELGDAIRADDEEATLRLLALGAPVNAPDGFGFTALEIAVLRSNTALVTLLLGNGADPNYLGHDGRAALHLAAEGGDATVARILLADDRVGINTPSEWKLQSTPLMFAVLSQDLDTIDLLLAAHACVDCQDAEGNTALHYAVIDVKSVDVVRTLLAAGASPDIASSRETPLESAVRLDLTDIQELLTSAHFLAEQ